MIAAIGLKVRSITFDYTTWDLVDLEILLFRSIVCLRRLEIYIVLKLCNTIFDQIHIGATLVSIRATVFLSRRAV